MPKTIRQNDVHRHHRCTLLLISLSVTVVLSEVSCTQPDRQYKGMTLDTGNKKSLSDLLPPIDVIESITLVNRFNPGGHADTPHYPTADLPKSDWPRVYSEFRHTKAIVLRATLTVYGHVILKTRDGQSHNISIFAIDGRDLVYDFQPNPKEVGSYFISTQADALLLNLLPKWQ